VNDTIVLPTQDAILALDLVGASLASSIPQGVALTDTDAHVRLTAMFRFNGIDGPFAQMVLDTALAHGQRAMFQRQPVHVRFAATNDPDTSLLER